MVDVVANEDPEMAELEDKILQTKTVNRLQFITQNALAIKQDFDQFVESFSNTASNNFPPVTRNKVYSTAYDQFIGYLVQIERLKISSPHNNDLDALTKNIFGHIQWLKENILPMNEWVRFGN